MTPLYASFCILSAQKERIIAHPDKKDELTVTFYSIHPTPYLSLESALSYFPVLFPNPFWVANLRIDGARAIEEAAAAAATRIFL